MRSVWTLEAHPAVTAADLARRGHREPGSPLGRWGRFIGSRPRAQDGAPSPSSPCWEVQSTAASWVLQGCLEQGVSPGHSSLPSWATSWNLEESSGGPLMLFLSSDIKGKSPCLALFLPCKAFIIFWIFQKRFEAPLNPEPNLGPMKTCFPFF